jgi:hypothetical protein
LYISAFILPTCLDYASGKAAYDSKHNSKLCYVLVIHKRLFLLQLFINNKFVDSVSGKTFPTLNPANEKKIADIAEADKVDSLN